MKILHSNIIFLLALFCVSDQQASSLTEACHAYEIKEMQKAIAAADVSLVDRKVKVSEQVELIDEAIMCRYHALGHDSVIDDTIIQVKGLYEKESKSKQCNAVAVVLLGQAIIAFLHGKSELGEKYLAEAQAIKKKESAQRSQASVQKTLASMQKLALLDEF